MHVAGGLPRYPRHPADEAITSLSWMKQAILAFPASHESAVEVDKVEVLQRMDMIAMSMAAILNHGQRPDLLGAIHTDASLALIAATDAVQRATWEVGRQVAQALMAAATAMMAMPSALSSPFPSR